MRARSASISLCVRLAERPVGVPSEGVWLSVSPVAAWRCGSRLSSSAAIRLASNFGCGFGGSGFFCGGVSAFCCVFGSGFFVSFFSASAIGSTFGSGSLAKACFGSDFCAGFGGFGSGFFCSGSGFGGSTLSEVATISGFLSTTLAFACCREPSHHAHHCTVIHLPVATHIDALVIAPPRGGNRLQLGHQIVHLDFGILQIDLALGVH